MHMFMKKPEPDVAETERLLRAEAQEKAEEAAEEIFNGSLHAADALWHVAKSYRERADRIAANKEAV
jgi:hypothetical protein